jgi:hypothetical protein
LEKIESYLSETLSGIVWKTLVDPVTGVLFIETRDHALKQVSFSALHLGSKRWLWKNVTLEESWWLTLAAASPTRLFLTLYADSQNPDKKSVFAYDLSDQKLVWWRNNFALTGLWPGRLEGVDLKFGSRNITLDPENGNELAEEAYLSAGEQNLLIIRPFQYQEGSDHFATVSRFLETKSHISPVISLEYSEFNSLILISAFVNRMDLANYLIVFNSDGQVLLQETLGEHLKGIALDTFFIFSGYLIFVKNNCELVIYKFV